MSLIILLFSLSSILTWEPQSISLTFDKELGFYKVPVSFGSEEKTVDVQVDTTTSETWIPCVKKYNITESKTGKKN